MSAPANVKGGLKCGEGSVVISPGDEKLSEELHGSCVLSASRILFTGEQISTCSMKRWASSRRPSRCATRPRFRNVTA